MTKIIATYGNKPRMPFAFPLDLAENSGNMIHARAPRRVLQQAHTIDYFLDQWTVLEEKNFAEFVNKHCDHLIISLANTIRVDSSRTEPYEKLLRMLELYDVPITIFGIGVRSITEDLDEITLSPQMIELLQYMDERCAPVGVRGEFTKLVFEEKAGMKNVMVTGCPSFFSEPDAFRQLRRELARPRPGLVTYSGTRYSRPEERAAFVEAVNADTFYIEPTSAENHRAHLQALKGAEIVFPNFIVENRLIAENDSKSVPGQVTVEKLTDLFRSRYRLFHDPDAWLDFNRRLTAFGYGTRFHVNMATILAGKPATWITHDSRTRELTDFLHLPTVSLEDSANMTAQDFREAANFDAMFDNLDALFDNWTEYMNAHDLPYTRPNLKI